MIAAHRGGTDNNPENTMLAYRKAVREIGIDIVESDLYLTKDGHLIYNHDSYIDETCNVNGNISYDEMMELIKDKLEENGYCEREIFELLNENEEDGTIEFERKLMQSKKRNFLIETFKVSS